MLPPSRLARFGLPASLLAIAGCARAAARRRCFVCGASTARACSRSASACSPSSSASPCSRRRSCRRSRACSAGPRRASAAPPARSRASNSMRNPARTASTAAALMIGLALVTARRGARGRPEDPFEGAVNDALRRPTTRSRPRTASRRPGRVRERAAEGPGRRASSPACAPGAARRSASQIERDRRPSPTSAGDQGRSGARVAGGAGRAGRNGAFVSKDYAKSHHLARRLAVRRSRRRRARCSTDVKGSSTRRRAARRSAT